MHQLIIDYHHWCFAAPYYLAAIYVSIVADRGLTGASTKFTPASRLQFLADDEEVAALNKMVTSDYYH